MLFEKLLLGNGGNNEECKYLKFKINEVKVAPFEPYLQI
jgi:hypothetical protein